MQPRVLFLLPLLFLTMIGCSRPPGLFSDQNARAHIGMLAGTIGSRPLGTEANARARTYIVDQLRLYGFEVRVQETDARRPSIGRTARVSNIIAIRQGRRAEAVGLVAHYDSAPESPGAADDGLGTGVALEAARVLAARTDRNWSLMVLLTDGEEAGLMGAAALIADREVTSRLQAYINLEAIGSSGPPFLFETGPANGWLVRSWARNAPWPRGGSFGIEVYRRLPNDTDFSILKRQLIPGLNLATVNDSYAYHTARDTPERLSPQTIRTTGEQAVALVLALDGVDITQRSVTDRTYFDIAGRTAGSYGPLLGGFIAAAALLLGIVAWVRITSAAVQLEGLGRWILTCVWTIAGASASAASMIGATWALRAARETYHPWYAKPDRLFLLLVAVGIASGWGVARLGHWLPERARVIRHPCVTWSITLPAWIVLAGAMFWLAPGAAYLWLLPLLTAGVLLVGLPPANDAASRAVSLAVFGVAAVMWLPNTTDLLRFIVAIFGRLPIVTPIFVYGVVISAAGLMIVPPLVAACAPRRPMLRPALVTACLLVAVAVTAGFAYVAHAYTYDQPLRRHVRALQETADGPAVWEVASTEPGLDLTPDAPGNWSPSRTAASTTLPWGQLPHPFVFRATGPTLGPAPAAISGFTVEPLAAGTEVTVTVVPHTQGLALSFVLPQGLVPARSSLPGVVRLGRWTATYVAPPTGGIAFRASFGTIDRARHRDLRVVVTDFGFSGGQGWQRLPAWLPQERAVWSVAATWVLSPPDPQVAQPGPLR